LNELQRETWAAAYDSEYVGFKESLVFKVVRQSSLTLDTLTRLAYEEDNDEYIKCKAFMCVGMDHHVAGEPRNIKETESYHDSMHRP
jgi:hypothetical protein